MPALPHHRLTPEQIERAVERMMDRIDARLMSGAITQAEYDAEVKQLDAWSAKQYAPRY